MGVDKFKNCLVGTFTKGSMSYQKVTEVTKKAWSSRGLTNVAQNGTNKFLFRFSSAMGMNVVLSRGTWYFDRIPLVLCAWGDTLDVSKIKTMPLWIKLSNLPDYYWTRECLSRVASVIGPPVCADKLTAQLNPLPFAHMCVTYSYGTPMPDSIPVATLGGDTVDVKVMYPVKPLSCAGCCSLGHLVGACPVTKRAWVQKLPQIPNAKPLPISLTSLETTTAAAPKIVISAFDVDNAESHTPNPNTVNLISDHDHGGWTEIKRKHKSPTPDFDDSSPSPLNTFKGLRNVDEIDSKKSNVNDHSPGSVSKRLSKSQRKKLKKLGEGNS